MKRFLLPILFAFLILVIGIGNVHAVKTFQRTAISGGTATALDGIDGETLTDGDWALVTYQNSFYVYVLNATSGASENYPNTIAPDTNPGNKRWILQSQANLEQQTVSQYGTLAAAVTAIGASNNTTLICDTSSYVSTAVTVTSNIHLKAEKTCLLTKSGSGTLTINGPFEAGLYQVFSGFTAGVTFGPNTVKEVYPQWFGAAGDDSTDDTTALQSAIYSAKNKKVFVPKGTYKITSTLTSTIAAITDRVNIQGVGYGSKINWRGGNGVSVINIKGSGNEGYYGRGFIEKLHINNANSSTTLTGIKLGDASVGDTAGIANMTIDNNTIVGMSKAIELCSLSVRITISNNWIYTYETQGVYLINGSNIRVINNAFQTGALGSLAVNIQAGTAITISNNYMGGTDSRAVYLSGGVGFSITDNYIEMLYSVGGGDYCIKVDGMSDGYIGGNEMGGFSTANLIWITSTSKNVQVGPNHHSQNGTDVASLVKIESGATGCSITAPQNTTGSADVSGAAYLLYNAKSDRVQIPIFNSLGGATANYVNVDTSTNTTLFTVTAGSCYLVFINQQNEGYGAAGVVYVPVGSSTAELYKTGSTNANLQLVVSGLNVQAWNNAGATRTVYYTALRIY